MAAVSILSLFQIKTENAILLTFILALWVAVIVNCTVFPVIDVVVI